MSPGMATRHARMRAPRRGRRAPRADGPLTHFGSPRREKGGLAEISGFSYRARSLLCKRQIGRQTARREDAGDSSRHGADFRGTDAAGCAGVTSPRRGFARANSCSSRRRIRATARTRRCLFPMLLKYSSFGEPVQPLSGTSPRVELEPMRRHSESRRTRESRRANLSGSTPTRSRLPLPPR